MSNKPRCNDEKALEELQYLLYSCLYVFWDKEIVERENNVMGVIV